MVGIPGQVDRGRWYNYAPLDAGFPAFVLVYSKAREDPIGWVLIIGDDDLGCLLVDIYVEPEYRRQGYGTDLLKVLQNRYRRVWTGLSNAEGRALCMKMGFALKRGVFGKDIPKLEWEAPNAKGTGKKAEKAGGK